MKRLLATLLCLSGLSPGCTPSVRPAQESKGTAYFSIASAIDQQVAVLGSRRAQSRKIIRVGANLPDTLAPQATDWEKELRLFKEADINKPAWIGEYEVSESAEEVRYKATRDSQPVRLLIVKSAAGKPVTVEAHLVQSNLLYQTEKHLQLSFKDGLLAAYRIDGYQKTFFSDTTRYSLAATVH